MEHNFLTAYKGFDKDLKCRGFQYETGKEYETDKAKACAEGFHACERPLDVFSYYAPGAGSRYCVVEQSGDLDRGRDDTKVASTRLKVGAEIGIPGLVKAQIEYVKAHTTTEHTDPDRATAGYRGAATAGDCGAATSRGTASVGEYGIACAKGNGCKVRGGIGAVLVIAEEERTNYKVKDWQVVVVDGKNIKPDTWYKLVDGILQEVTDE